MSCKGCGHKSKKVKNQTRESCIYCVEKHIASANELCTEIRDGYKYRLMVIGRLFEAEDESQAYQELHDFIRQSRIKYQTEDIFPNFDLIGEMIWQQILTERTENEKI